MSLLAAAQAMNDHFIKLAKMRAFLMALRSASDSSIEASDQYESEILQTLKVGKCDVGRLENDAAKFINRYNDLLAFITDFRAEKPEDLIAEVKQFCTPATISR